MESTAHDSENAKLSLGIQLVQSVLTGCGFRARIYVFLPTGPNDEKDYSDIMISTTVFLQISHISVLQKCNDKDSRDQMGHISLT